MAQGTNKILDMAQAGFAAMDDELARSVPRQYRSVFMQAVNGSGHLNVVVKLVKKFRFVFARCHFVGGSGTATLTISVDSGRGSAFDIQLTQQKQRGTGADLSFGISGAELTEPSAWTFQEGDAIRIQWTNPAPISMTWGLEVGLALAS